ncbi:hypothetical protein AKG39_00995 [Acetobacterium bakii]|uniref:Uncharacterized protein n=1 Tax=Acetobacterium bakii TaxID=52689 RepID=A0A0L6U4S6_9FIRM|nr:hypothetical protein AKG39_00995 [Acetobacterium bakii]
MKSKRRSKRNTVIIYLVLSLTAVVINYIYGLLGHGVSSPAMTWMFLYPLLGGALLFFLINVLIPCSSLFAGYRLFFNAYNSGIATLTLGSFLKGILDIAGTSSPYIVLFYGVGWLFISAGLILLLKLYAKHRKIFSTEKRASDSQISK